MNEEEIVKGLRWMAKVRTVCEDSICECHKCEFHGFCTDPDDGESLGKQSDWLTEAASLIESLRAQLSESQRREIARGIDHLRGLAEMVSGIAPDRLREIVEAEQDGRLVVLPCKVGETVWIHALVPCGACPHGADPAKICGQAGCPVHPIPVSFSVRMYDVIGKTVFLTLSEAEAALEKMKEDEENDR